LNLIIDQVVSTSVDPFELDVIGHASKSTFFKNFFEEKVREPSLIRNGETETTDY
jgi:hypothetical protein